MGQAADVLAEPGGQAALDLQRGGAGRAQKGQARILAQLVAQYHHGQGLFRRKVQGRQAGAAGKAIALAALVEDQRHARLPQGVQIAEDRAAADPARAGQFFSVVSLSSLKQADQRQQAVRLREAHRRTPPGSVSFLSIGQAPAAEAPACGPKGPRPPGPAARPLRPAWPAWPPAVSVRPACPLLPPAVFVRPACPLLPPAVFVRPAYQEWPPAVSVRPAYPDWRLTVSLQPACPACLPARPRRPAWRGRRPAPTASPPRPAYPRPAAASSRGSRGWAA